MMENIKISVIVIVSDTEKYLKKCLDSITNQTLKEIEIIVVDDFSKNNILPLIKNYIEDSRLKFIQLHEKKGPGGARNAGLSEVKGKYISFCDSDDWLDIEFYEKAYQHMEEESADIGMCGLVRNYDAEMVERIYKCKYEKVISLNSDFAFRIMTKEYDNGINIIPSSVNKIYKQDFLNKFDLTFMENVFYEDLLFSFRAILSANKIICIPDVYYHHYKRIGSIVQSFSSNHIEGFYKVFEAIRQYLKDSEKYELYKFNYYKFGEQFYNLIIRQIFEYSYSDEQRKIYMRESFQYVKKLIDFEEYLEYVTAEKLRQHIQPHISSTKIL